MIIFKRDVTDRQTDRKKKLLKTSKNLLGHTNEEIVLYLFVKRALKTPKIFFKSHYNIFGYPSTVLSFFSVFKLV